jgi:hypothetical protein
MEASFICCVYSGANYTFLVLLGLLKGRNEFLKLRVSFITCTEFTVTNGLSAKRRHFANRTEGLYTSLGSAAATLSWCLNQQLAVVIRAEVA